MKDLVGSDLFRNICQEVSVDLPWNDSNKFLHKPCFNNCLPCDGGISFSLSRPKNVGS